MSRDLGFSDRVIGMGIGVFFFSYLALQIPGALLVERWSARRVVSSTMIAWGTLTAFTALVRTPTQLYLARFVLGAAEAAFFPGVIVYLSHWFIRQDRAKATSNFMAAIPLSLCIGSPIAGWILGHRWFHIEGWRWLFVLEGLPAVLLGIVAYFLLTDWPEQASWLSAEQRGWIRQRLAEEKKTTGQGLGIRNTLRSPVVVLLSAIAFLDYLAGYTTIFWLPTILKRQSGYSDLHLGLLTAIPYATALVAMLINGWHSDQCRERRWHAVAPLLLTAIGLVGLLAFPGSMRLSVFWFCLACMTPAFLPPFWSIPTEIMSEAAAAAAVGMINGVASIAGFAGPYAFGYLATRTGSLNYGFAGMLLAVLMAAVVFVVTPLERHRPAPATLAYDPAKV